MENRFAKIKIEQIPNKKKTDLFKYQRKKISKIGWLFQINFSLAYVK